jgi:hypothetical protein
MDKTETEIKNIFLGSEGLIRMDYGRRRFNDRLSAFSLVELLVSSLVAPLLLLGLAAAIYLPLRMMRHTDDIDTAQARAEMVFSILKKPLEQCGYGLPKDATRYRDSFQATMEPFTWPGPISVDDSKNALGVRENGKCRIMFAVRTAIRTISEASTSSDRLEVRTSGIPLSMLGEADDAYKENRIGSWVVFGSMLPYCLPARPYAKPVKLSNREAILSLMVNRASYGGEKISIPENDQLFYLRALECEVRKRGDNFVFATKDHSGSGWQPRVDGVVDVRFELEEGGRILRVSTLTMGRHRYPDAVTRKIPGWPEKYSEDIPDSARHYMLMANETSFTMKNL